jgi:hypothetical protein
MTNTISTVHQTIPIRKERFINERYPTTALEQNPFRKLNNYPAFSRLNLCFLAQSVALPKIYETDEENQQQSQAKIYTNSDRFGFSENIRRTTSKYLHRQKLPTTQEEICETDSN